MKQIILALTAMLLFNVNAQADKYTDENRPYKFAFNIEGYQHRSEEKDEKGLIKGEYGFVTGDGVYHVTVYATDENGNFKILSMKNYFIGLPTDGPTQSTPQTTPRMLTTLKRTNTPPPTIKTTPPAPRTTQGGIVGCGGCKIPTTSSRPNLNSDLDFDIDVRFKEDNNAPEEEPPKSNNVAFQSPMRDRTTPKIDRVSPGQPLKANKSPSRFGSSSTTQKIISNNGITTARPFSASIKPGSPTTTDKSKLIVNKGANSPIKNSLQNQTSKDKLQAKSKDSDSKVSDKSSSKSNLLYEFNQTQSFQGQFEQGFVDNSKKGDYFVNDRDGVRRVVEYEANENGFQPHIRFEKITGSDVPIPETEKDVNELKGVYFKWFYGR